MIRLALLFATLAAGCYKPSLENCQYTCASGEGCPAGFTCLDGMCTHEGESCGVDAPASDSRDGDVPCTDGMFCREVSTVTEHLTGIWGISPTDLWAVGDNGVILHRDQTGTWTRSMYGDSTDFTAIFGFDVNTIVAAGNGGQAYEFDGMKWSGKMIDGAATDFHGATATMQSAVVSIWVVGDNGRIWRRDTSNANNVWTSFPNTAATLRLHDITPASGGDLITGGQSEQLYYRGAGASGTWAAYGPPGVKSSDPYTALFGVGATNDLYAGSAHGVDHWDGVGGHSFGTELPGVAIEDIDGMVGEIYACGDGVFHRKAVGGGWDKISDIDKLNGVKVFRDDVFVVGMGGQIYHLHQP